MSSLCRHARVTWWLTQAFAFSLATPIVFAQGRGATLTVEQIFSTNDFWPKFFGGAQWLDDSSYTILEQAKAPAKGADIVRYDAATGNRTALVSAVNLVPPEQSAPLSIEEYQFSR